MTLAVGAAPAAAASPLSGRTREMLQAPILPLLLRLAWPNVLIMLAQASAQLIETWWISQLGTAALAGMALVFPPIMLTQMISAGAMGGGISSAIARALGAGRRAEADALVLHAVVVNVVLGVAVSAVFLLWGREIFAALGGEGAALDAAVAYADVVFAGNVLLWLLNGLASVIRGTGNMLVPALVICAGVVLLVPLSPLLIFGLGPIPALGIAGGATALVLFYAGGTAVLAWYILSGRNLVRFRPTPMRWPLFRSILRVGAVGAVTSLQTNLTIALVTALAASVAGTAAVAGFGTAVRLEYLLVPLVFGLGAPVVALVGTNVGAGLHARALRIAMTAGGIAFAMTESIGLAAAIWPEAWLGLFSAEPAMLEAGSAYLRIVGPAYGFFGLGLVLYFASQGAGQLLWPLCVGFLRLAIAAGGGWLALSLTGSLAWLFAAVAAALVVYGVTLALAVRSGVWFRRTPGQPQ